LNSPFAYLRTLADEIKFPSSNAHGSDQIRLGALHKIEAKTGVP
jgi:hypothetical protein